MLFSKVQHVCDPSWENYPRMCKWSCSLDPCLEIETKPYWKCFLYLQPHFKHLEELELTAPPHRADKTWIQTPSSQENKTQALQNSHSCHHGIHFHIAITQGGPSNFAMVLSHSQKCRLWEERSGDSISQQTLHASIGVWSAQGTLLLGTGKALKRSTSQLTASSSRKEQKKPKLSETGQRYTARVSGSDKICTFHIHPKMLKGHLAAIFNVCMTPRHQISLLCRLMVFPRLLLIVVWILTFTQRHSLHVPWTKAMREDFSTQHYTQYWGLREVLREPLSKQQAC